MYVVRVIADDRPEIRLEVQTEEEAGRTARRVMARGLVDPRTGEQIPAQEVAAALIRRKDDDFEP